MNNSNEKGKTKIKQGREQEQSIYLPFCLIF